MMAIELVTGTSPVVASRHPETETCVPLEGECDRAPIVCPIVVVFPDNWIRSPGDI